MKKFFLILSAFLTIVVIACNNADKTTNESADTQKAQADSLEKEVIEGHDVAMPKSMKIPKLQKEAQRLIDSINKLPAKAKDAASSYKANLESLVKELDEAHTAMEQWMNEFKYDSARDNLEQRIKYLAEEKLKVEKVKDAVLGSLQKADTLLKRNF